MLLQVGLCAASPFLLLRVADGFRRADYSVLLARPHLDKDQRIVCSSDDINFTVSRTQVVCYDLQPLLLEVARGEFFAVLPAPEMRGEFVKHKRWPVSGVLYIVATPIGNLQDMTARAQAILAQVDAIACEDTRHSRRLLDAYAIDKPLIALHQHNEHGASEALLSRLRNGEQIALVSDAGTPLISDPGQWLTRLALEQGITVVPIPGVSSVMAALSVSGLSADQFVFAGFIPAKEGERARFIEAHGQYAMTTVFFETPHRIEASIAAMAAQLDGSRMIVFARELTKQFEQIARMPLMAASEWLQADRNRTRGEFVLILEGQSAAATEDTHWQQMARDLACAGMSSKDSAAFVAKYTGAKKKSVYQYLIEQNASTR